MSDSVPVIDSAESLTPSRRIIRALRRTDFDHNPTSDVQDKQPAQTGVTCTGTGADKASGNTKGTSIKLIKERNKARVKEYKTKRKKKNKNLLPSTKIDPKQRLIKEFYKVSDINQYVAGLEPQLLPPEDHRDQV